MVRIISAFDFAVINKIQITSIPYLEFYYLLVTNWLRYNCNQYDYPQKFQPLQKLILIFWFGLPNSLREKADNQISFLYLYY